jgi:hypothetical protein
VYVILTSKPGQFRTELVDGLNPVATYDYLFCGRKRAEFTIAELTRDVRLRIIDEAEPPRLNEMPSKFLPKFGSVEDAFAELCHLTKFGGMDAVLHKR